MKSITILGIYVADLAFFGDSIPNPGETILGKNYRGLLYICNLPANINNLQCLI